MGIVVFEMGPKDPVIYETLREQLNSVLWRAHLNQLIRSLYEASSSVLSLQEPQAILDDVVRKTCRAVGAKGANIIFIDKKEPSRLAIGANHGSAFYTSTLISVEPILIEDMQFQTGLLYQQMYREGIDAAGCFPLLVKGKTVGVMWVFFEKPHRFLAAEVEALRLYVNQAAIAYDKAKRMKELEHLQQASEKLASVADVREVLQQIADSAHDVLQADSVAIWPYDAIRQTFLPDELVTQGIDERLVQKSKLDKPSPDDTAETVIREGYLAVSDVNDVRCEYLGLPQAHGLRGAIGVKSFQGIVLKVVDDVLGVLYVNYKVSRGFDDEEEATLKTFAHHAALALKKARLLEQVRMAYDTATVVAEVSAQEDLQSTLNAIVKGTLDAFQCDAVTLNSYNPVTNELGYPPAMSGVNYPERVQRTKGVEPNSLVHTTLQRKEPFIVDYVAQNDDFKNRRFVNDEEIKSCMAIRLDAAGQKVGVMFVNYRTPHHFTGQEIDDVKLFANQAAVAIRNAQLYDDAMRKTRYLQALYDAGTAVTSTLTLDEILNRIVEQASLLTAHKGQQAIFCNLALKENNRLIFKVSYSASHVPSLVGKGTIIDLEGDKRIGIAGRVVKTGRSQLVLDVTQDPDCIIGTPEMKSLLAVPIIIGKNVIGVIAIGHSSAGAFNQDDLDCVESLSTQAALAIRNAQLYNEATKRAQYLQALYDAGTAVTSTLSLDEILERIVEQVRRMTGSNGRPADPVRLGLIDGTKLRIKAWRSKNSHGLQAMTSVIDLEQDTPIGIMGRVVKTGISILSNDVTQDKDYLEYDVETRSELAVPIKLGEKIIGVINVELPEYGAFDEADQQSLEALAVHVAIAIQNARQFEELQALDKKKTEFLSTVSHELRTPLATVQGSIQNLLSGMYGSLNEEQHCKLNMALARARGETRLIENLLDLARIQEGKVTLDARGESLSKIIQDVVEVFRYDAMQKHITLKEDCLAGEPLKAKVDSGKIKQVLNNLIINALKFTPQGGVIAVSARKSGDCAEIQVMDTGIGIPQKEFGKIFERFYQVNSSLTRSVGGTGIGLNIAKEYVEMHGGRMWVESEVGKGSNFIFTLPLRKRNRSKGK
ncbi:MAG: GAF domain-containing protein [Anaerolineales bacterium]